MQRRWGRPVVRFKRATADSHGEVQGSRKEMEDGHVPAVFQPRCTLVWLVKLQERVKRVDSFARDNN